MRAVVVLVLLVAVGCGGAEGEGEGEGDAGVEADALSEPEPEPESEPVPEPEHAYELEVFQRIAEPFPIRVPELPSAGRMGSAGKDFEAGRARLLNLLRGPYSFLVQAWAQPVDLGSSSTGRMVRRLAVGDEELVLLASVSEVDAVHGKFQIQAWWGAPGRAIGALDEPFARGEVTTDAAGVVSIDHILDLSGFGLGKRKLVVGYVHLGQLESVRYTFQEDDVADFEIYEVDTTWDHAKLFFVHGFGRTVYGRWPVAGVGRVDGRRLQTAGELNFTECFDEEGNALFLAEVRVDKPGSGTPVSVGLEADCGYSRALGIDDAWRYFVNLPSPWPIEPR